MKLDQPGFAHGFVRGLAVLALALSSAAYVHAKPRVFITESHPLQVAGKTSPEGGQLLIAGGTTPENTEVMKSFVALCPEVTITSNREKASYVVRLDHEPLNPFTLVSHGNKVAVFNQTEDLIYSGSSRLLGASVKAACAAIARAERK
jgi:hypothetical protein